MSHLFIQGVEQYGYLAIFLFVFMQEIGFPSPIPNEYVLLFSGYMSSVGMLNIVFVIGVIVTADIVAGLLLFELFYRAGKALHHIKRPTWIYSMIERLVTLKIRIQQSGLKGTIVGRLTPFIRGWVVVICGLSHMPRSLFGKMLIGTTCVWTIAYVGVGYFIGPQVQLLYSQNKPLGMLLILLPLFAFIVSHLIRTPFTRKGHKFIVKQNGV
jgi:membrane protein DedA with SNARE-associated domain